MKKTFVLLFLFCINVSLPQQWEWQNPYPVRSDFKNVQLISSTTAFICGNSNTLIKTTDAGRTWQIISLDYLPPANVNACYFFNADTGLFVAYWDGAEKSAIYKTTDGGKTFQTKITLTYEYFTDIDFYNKDIGYAGGTRLYRTTNGGETWSLTSNYSFWDCYHIQALDKNTVAIIGFDYVKLTTDGGRSWKSLLGEYWFENFYFINKDTAFVIGYGLIHRTTDGGTTWTHNKMPGCWSVFFNTDKTGYAFGGPPYYLPHQFGIIMKTTDLGDTWTEMPAIAPQYLECAFFFDSLNGMAAGRIGTIVGTTDGGEHWNLLSRLVTTDTLFSVYVIDANNVFASGSNGTIIHTTNAGKNWELQNSGTPVALTSIAFSDPMNGIAAGSSGTIVYTTNGGDNWNVEKPLNYDSTFSSVSYIKNSGTAFISSPLFKTTDYGATWEFMSYQTFSSLSFISADTGFGAGEGIAKTTDGGLTWTDLDLQGNFKFITFSDSYFGAAASRDSAVIYITSDGGVNWKYIPIDPSLQILMPFLQIHGLSITESNYITVLLGGVGYNETGEYGTIGKIYRSTDRGSSWSVQNLSSYIMNSIDYFDKSIGYAVGPNGAVIKTNNSSVPVELSLFTISETNNEVKLLWQTSSEINNKGFEVQRKSDASFENIAFITGHGTSTEMQYYSYTEKNLSPGTYTYRLKQIDYNGSYTFSKELKFENKISSLKYSLQDCYPNPFNPVTKIKYSIPVKGNVSLKIYDILGREAAVLINEVKQPDMYEAEWNAASYSSGVYFYRIKASGYTETKKMILMK